MGLQMGFGQGWLFWVFYWIPVLLIGLSPSVSGTPQTHLDGLKCHPLLVYLRGFLRYRNTR